MILMSLCFNEILNRLDEENTICNTIDDIFNERTNKRGIYIYGETGCGKSSFAIDILKKHDYDFISYNASDVRNKAMVESLSSANVTNNNIIGVMSRNPKKIVIVMDEIDGMNNGDRGGLTALIQLLNPNQKPRKNDKDNSNIKTSIKSPVICIGDCHVDKKILELKKVCVVCKLNAPTKEQISTITSNLFTDLNELHIKNMNDYIDCDLRKLTSMYNMYKLSESSKLFANDVFMALFRKKHHNKSPQSVVTDCFKHQYEINQHTSVIDDVDRTVVGLLWHENIIDIRKNMPSNQFFNFYEKTLENICYADCIDRIMFQKQLWQFNEISSIIKTFGNVALYHQQNIDYCPSDVRFTKTLTKYITEYNNNTFILSLCQKLNIDKKDMLLLFYNIRNAIPNMTDIYTVFNNNSNYDISKLNINRLYKYLDMYINKYISPKDTTISPINISSTDDYHQTLISE